MLLDPSKAQCEESKSRQTRIPWPRAAAEKPFQRSGYPVRMEAAGARLGRRVVPDGYWADGDPSRGPMPASVAIDWS